MSERCMYCFEPMLKDGVCPNCHKSSNAPVRDGHITPGSVVRGRFVLGRALGQDDMGIVYIALDVKTEKTLRIRELFPRDLALRTQEGTVAPKPGCEEKFTQALNEMRSSVDTGDDTKRRLFFEDNGTGYLAQRRIPQKTAGETEDAQTYKPSKSMSIAAAIVAGAAVIAAVIYFLVK